MNDLAIKVDHVSKEYRLGAIGGATLKAELQSKIAKIRHKEDPNLKIGAKSHDPNERFLALRDVSFEVKKGETVGIIGHNGAGKSTILKLICRVTYPTSGQIYMNGRLTSMLEVGTGFHPELTGRENVFLNGAILGMSKAEVQKKFDEIVEFSEVGQFIDTPIKRYSSGMKVKLAFAVASHLDSEIMIMDEVLAVGDVAFQNKCIERMKKVAAEEGRTILYVSHNMPTVRSLCDRCVVLSHGESIFDGNTDEAIEIYAKNDFSNEIFYDVSSIKRNSKCNLQAKINQIEIFNRSTNIVESGDKLNFKIKWQCEDSDKRVLFKIVIDSKGNDGVGVAYCGEIEHHQGNNESSFSFDTSYLFPGKYTLFFKLYDEDCSGNVVYYDQCRGIDFEIVHSDESTHLMHWFADWGNAVLPCVKQI